MEDVGNQFVKDLAMQVAGRDCCFLGGKAEELVRRPMHVSFQHNAIDFLNSLDASRLRTLVFFPRLPIGQDWMGRNHRYIKFQILARLETVKFFFSRAIWFNWKIKAFKNPLLI
ncbi:unnamed protein product [Vicia faba]|uniref:Uncharacterized protein n=1 Tax=Vicia faba TaxID=3906 RepID=A0AAV1AFR4_VICFA|nr:unnamed protein product [Vicia faba]